jgi:hypothetical protein
MFQEIDAAFMALFSASCAIYETRHGLQYKNPTPLVLPESADAINQQVSAGNVAFRKWECIDFQFSCFHANSHLAHFAIDFCTRYRKHVTGITRFASKSFRQVRLLFKQEENGALGDG